MIKDEMLKDLDQILVALEFYANRENWSSHYTPTTIPGSLYQPAAVKVDGGQVARDILRRVGGKDFPDQIDP